MIPIFMSGEEFDADYHPLPSLSPDLYGGKNPGQGRWLYGGQLDWSELRKDRHREALADVTRMLEIRKRERSILSTEIRGDIQPNLMSVPHVSDIDVPVPYMRWHERKAIIVLANRNTEKDAHFQLNVPLGKLGTPQGQYLVTDLWTGGEPRVVAASELGDFAYTVKRDKTLHGGIGLIKIEPVGNESRLGSSSPDVPRLSGVGEE